MFLLYSQTTEDALRLFTNMKPRQNSRLKSRLAKDIILDSISSMKSTDSGLSLTDLREMIGTRVRFESQYWEIVEVLEDGPAIILQDYNQHTIIQADQHGEAHRHVPSTRTVPIFASDGESLSAAFLSMDLDAT